LVILPGEHWREEIDGALRRVPMDGTVDLRGLEERQLFFDSRRRTFEECRAGKERGAFALGLYKQLVALLGKYPC
jgi:hypothetical protein